MSEPRRSRQIIALLAAYAVALQALLLPLSLAAGASPHFSLCASAMTAASPHSEDGHGGGCPCAAGCGMQCCVHALAGPPQAEIVLAPASAVRLAPTLALTQVSWPRPYNPQLARAPPAT